MTSSYIFLSWTGSIGCMHLLYGCMIGCIPGSMVVGPRGTGWLAGVPGGTLKPLRLCVGWLAGWLAGWPAGRLAGWPAAVIDFEYPCCFPNSATAVAHRLACTRRSDVDFAKSVVFPCLDSLCRPPNLKQLEARALFPHKLLLLAVLQSLWFFGRRDGPVWESMDGKNK